MSTLFPDLPKASDPLTTSMADIAQRFSELNRKFNELQAMAEKAVDITGQAVLESKARELVDGLDSIGQTVLAALEERMPRIADPMVREVIGLLTLNGQIGAMLGALDGGDTDDEGS